MSGIIPCSQTLELFIVSFLNVGVLQMYLQFNLNTIVITKKIIFSLVIQQQHIQLLKAKIDLFCIFLYKWAVNVAKAQMWNNCSNNSCQIIGLSQCHFEIPAQLFPFLWLLVLE